MFYHALTGENEVPEYEMELGTMTVSLTATTKVTLGYKPKILLIINGQTSQTAALTTISAYNESVATNSAKYLSKDTSTDYTIPNNEINKIASIDDDGFTFNKSSVEGKLFRYVAIK